MSWDGFFNDMDMAIQRDDFQKAVNLYQARIAALNEVARDGQETAAGLYGVRAAVIAQLERYDPSNPVIKDDSLVERIKKAAVSAFRIGKQDYVAAKEVGRTFRIPGHEGPVKPVVPVPVAASPFAKAVASLVPLAPFQPSLTAVHNHPAHIELQQQYAGSLALRAALSEVVKQLDPNHPLLSDHFLQSNIRKAGITAFIMGRLDYDAARSAGLSFVLPKPVAGEADKPSS